MNILKIMITALKTLLQFLNIKITVKLQYLRIQIENEKLFGYTELGSILGTSMSAAGSLLHS